MVDASAIMSPSCSTPLRRSVAITGYIQMFQSRFRAIALPATDCTSNDDPDRAGMHGRSDRAFSGALRADVSLGDRLLDLSRLLAAAPSVPARLRLFLALATGAAICDFLRGLVVLGELFQLRFEFGAPCGDLLRQFVGGVSRKAASSSMLSESRSIFAMEPPVCFWLPGRWKPQASARALSTANALQTDDHNPATPLPNSRPNRDRQWQRGTTQKRIQKRMGMNEQEDRPRVSGKKSQPRRELQGHAGKIRTRARGILRHHARQSLERI